MIFDDAKLYMRFAFGSDIYKVRLLDETEQLGWRHNADSRHITDLNLSSNTSKQRDTMSQSN